MTGAGRCAAVPRAADAARRGARARRRRDPPRERPAVRQPARDAGVARAWGACRAPADRPPDAHAGARRPAAAAVRAHHRQPPRLPRRAQRRRARLHRAGPDRVWVEDITYIPTREGWLYLAVLLDLYSRLVVGWAMRADMERQLCLDALTMALTSRRPGPGLLHHTDRGSQYASHDYRAVLDGNGMVCSMSRKGDCWDNAVAESFFKTLKSELIDHADFATRADARRAIFEFIEVWYNRQRLHSHLDYRTPMEYEALPLNAALTP
jgi:putative transposase